MSAAPALTVRYLEPRYLTLDCSSGTVILAKLGEAFNAAHPMLDPDCKNPDIKDWQRWRDVLYATYDCASAR